MNMVLDETFSKGFSAGDGIWTREIQRIMGLAVPRRTRLGHPGKWIYTNKRIIVIFIDNIIFGATI